MSIPILHDKLRNYLIIGNEAVLLHCHQYNSSLQETILLPDYIDGYTIQFQAAAETAKSLLSSSMEVNNEKDAVFTKSDHFFRKMGMGNIDFSNISENGGIITIPQYHFDIANKLDRVNNSPTTFVFAAGYIAGTLNYAYGKNFNVRVKSLEKPFRFECHPIEGEEISINSYMNEAFADGSKPNTIPDDTTTNSEISKKFLNNLPTENDHGIIEDNGSLLSYLPASYYNKISFRFEKEMEITAGFEGLAEPLLLECAQIGGFNILSWIMKTTIWKSTIVQNITNNIDYINTFFSFINALGWGYWQIIESSNNQDITFRVYHSPESVGYKQEFGKSDLAKCYRITGSSNAISNLAHYGDIKNNPLMNEDFYHQLFSRNDIFQTIEKKCLAQGADLCEFKTFK
jgi:predicted hydrocarbon binding protein